jgi:phospholipid/cholesterol/gamma-HCH transport system substrate-binding protein
MKLPRRPRWLRFPRLPSARDLNPIPVGLVSLAFLAALVGTAMAVGTFGLLKHQYQMSGVFHDTGGLHKGANVRLAGVNVGQVTGVSPDFHHGQVVITWKVNHGVHLGPNTRADIGATNLLGGDVLELSNTSGGTSYEHRPGSQRRIPIQRTSVPYTLTSALGDFTTDINKIDIPTVDKLLRQVATNVESTSPDLPALLQNLDLVSKAVTSRQAQLSQLLTNSQRLTSTLASRDQQLVQLIDQADQLLDVLNSRRDELSSALGNGSQIVQQLGNLITTKRAQIDSILSDLHRTLQVSQRQIGNVNAGLTYAAPTFERLSAVAGPKAFRVQVTGIGPLNLSRMNDILRQLVGGNP